MQLFFRFIAIKKQQMTQIKPWTQYEDLILKKLKDQDKLPKWTIIAQIMAEQYNLKGRNGKQCKERYQNLFDNSEQIVQWNYEQEQKLFLLHSQLGNKWAIIGQQINNRSDNEVKNHLYSKLRKALRKLNKVIKQNFKKEFKQIKQNLIYKIIEGAQDKFKNAPLLDLQVSEYCTELKMKMLNYSYDEIQLNPLADFQNNKYAVRELIEEMIEFTRDYKRKPKKVRRASGQEYDCLMMEDMNLLLIPQETKRIKSTGNSPCNSQVSQEDSEDMSEFNSFALKVPKGLLGNQNKIDKKQSNNSSNRERKNQNIIIKLPTDTNYLNQMQEEKQLGFSGGYGGFGNFAPQGKDSNNVWNGQKNVQSTWNGEKVDPIWTIGKNSSQMVDQGYCVESQLNKVGILEESEDMFNPPHPQMMRKLTSSKKSNFSKLQIEEEQQHMFNDDSGYHPRIQMTAVQGMKFLMLDSSLGRSDKLFESHQKEKAFGMLESVESKMSQKLFSSIGKQ